MATNANGLTSGSGVNQLTAENAEYYQRVMLERLLPNLFFMKYGEKKTIPKNSGTTTSFRRLNSLTPVTTALPEGVQPDGVDLSVTKVTATVQQYGNYTKVSDLLDMAGLDPIIQECSELMGENAGESMDIITRDIIGAGTNVFYANGKLSRATLTAADKVNIADILKIRRTMKRNKVKTIKLPNGKSGYLAFTHTDVITDLMQTQEWKDQNTYINNDNRVEGTAGQLYGIYFLEADNALKFAGAGASSADVFGTLIVGKGAYGVPEIDGSSAPEIIVKPKEVIGGALEQFSTVGWKAAFTSVRLQELAMVRYESGATA